MPLEQLFILILLILLLKAWWKTLRRRLRQLKQRANDRLPRHWRPKSPHDCSHCQAGVSLQLHHKHRDVIPYAQTKDPRGCHKRIATQGFACPNPTCAYFGIIDQAIHALVGYGKLGQHKHIQRLRCQACRCAFSSRRGTPFYYLKSNPQHVEMVLWLLAEGVDLSVMVRYTGHVDATVARWLTRSGQLAARWHDRLFRDLSFDLIQMDELYAKVRGIEQARWLWLAIDPVSKAIPALHLGGRRADDAYALVHDLKLRLLPDCVPAFTTDGLRAYFYAITAHFGSWHRPPRARTDHWQPDDRLLHGQLVKRKQSRKLVFTITRMLWGQRSQLNAILTAHGFPPNIQTALIERVNLTIRQSVAPLTRKTWSLPQSEQHLLDHVQWWRLYYHFARPHESLRQPIPGLQRRFRARSPAMALGLTDRLWLVSDILSTPIFDDPSIA